MEIGFLSGGLSTYNISPLGSLHHHDNSPFPLRLAARGARSFNKQVSLVKLQQWCSTAFNSNSSPTKSKSFKASSCGA